MTKNNEYIIPKEVNKKPFETVYELKNETPSFEEFMKTYENDGNVNYADLNSDDISESRGYGPCNWNNSNCSCSQGELQIIYNNTTNISIRNNIYNIWIVRWPGTTPSADQTFRFEITSRRGETMDDWYKYLEHKPRYGYSYNSNSDNLTRDLLRKTNNANWKEGWDHGDNRYYKTASVLLENINDGEDFLKYLEKEYIKVNGRHGRMDRGGHSSLVNVLQRNINNYCNGSSVNDRHVNQK